jgi:hypothetical protein
MSKDLTPEAVRQAMARREFLHKAAAGTIVAAIGGGLYWLASDDLTKRARAQKLPDGRPRLPPGQRVIVALRPMESDAARWTSRSSSTTRSCSRCRRPSSPRTCTA